MFIVLDISFGNNRHILLIQNFYFLDFGGMEDDPAGGVADRIFLQ